MGFGRNQFISGVPGTNQKESNRKETHDTILQPDFYQKFILVLCLMLVRDKTDMKCLKYRF